MRHDHMLVRVLNTLNSTLVSAASDGISLLFFSTRDSDRKYIRRGRGTQEDA